MRSRQPISASLLGNEPIYIHEMHISLLAALLLSARSWVSISVWNMADRECANSWSSLLCLWILSGLIRLTTPVEGKLGPRVFHLLIHGIVCICAVDFMWWFLHLHEQPCVAWAVSFDNLASQLLGIILPSGTMLAGCLLQFHLIEKVFSMINSLRIDFDIVDPKQSTI